MNPTRPRKVLLRLGRIVASALASLTLLAMAPAASALTLTVTGVDNTVTPATQTPLTGYRWLIEEDKTYHVPKNPDGTVSMTGGVPDIDPNWRVGDPLRNTLSVSFHRSYMPVVATGSGQTELNAVVLDPGKNYFISVLPDDGYSIGGAPFKGDDAAVTVYANKNPIPTAQISIFVHEDIAPINNVWDLGESGLEGFAIILEDAGGKYGISAGIQSLDVFGNPLCTSYQFTDLNSNGVHDPGEPFVADVNGNPIVSALGAGCVSGPDGRVVIRNLAPGKYGVMAVPPNAVEDPNNPGNYISSNWVQTSTIEGKKVIDAWVKANEPNFFGEFGPAGPHVSIGFVPAGPNNPFVDATALSGGATISGQVVNLHLSRPPDTAFYNGGPFPHTTPWVGLNLGAAGDGRGVFAKRANSDGSFSIPNVPPGAYELVVWDDNLDLLFARSTVVVNPDGTTCNTLDSCNLGDVPVFQWFARTQIGVYNDDNGNAIWDFGESPMLEQATLLRFRDGTEYQAFPTDGEGMAPYDEVFPFFSWLVMEVDFARFKPTGAHIFVDDGGPIPFGDPNAFDDNLNPQPQGVPADPDSSSTDMVSRVETGPVLTEGFQAFLGQTNVIHFGKQAYQIGENGGISGIVRYAVTRAEDNPELAAPEPWEPGIPNVAVNLYAADGTTLLATATTDSWDDSLPANCQFGVNAGSATDAPFTFRGTAVDCYDGMRVWNQVRPGVFDGGYAFGPEIDCADFTSQALCDANTHVTGTSRYLNVADYIVEVVPPAGYEVIRSQDRNVDFGDAYFPSPELLPPPCVGEDYEVPPELALFPGVPAPMAGQFLPLCDRRQVVLNDGANAAVDFFLFTEVPIAGHLIGFILDDTANEFDPTSPQFGEKYAPPFLPVSIRDWTGREIARTVSDEYGRYNAMVPSTFTENLGQPSGISPNMLTTCMNSKTRGDGSPDPLHNPQYSQFCYTFQYMPGSTTYLDTPVVPVAAFAGPDQNPLDCEYVDTTPRIYSVDVAANGEGGGPYLPVNNQGDIIAGGIEITSMGTQTVPNPAYDGVGGIEPKTITRDYGFGDTEGTVTLGGTPIAIDTWNNATISADAAGLGIAQGPQQLVVTRADGSSTITGVTVQVGLRQGASVIAVTPGTNAIQNAIDAAGRNDLILVGPGTYNEMVVMYKPVQLQGWGEGSTVINAIKTPVEKLTAWRNLTDVLVNTSANYLVPGQEIDAPGIAGIEPETFFAEEGAGVFVLAQSSGNTRFAAQNNRNARIDGFTITGADTGGGIVVNGHANYLDISNNRVTNNNAFFAGGIRIGHAQLTAFVGNNLVYSDADNNFIQVHHNTVTQNGGLQGAGGGIALYTGTDEYEVTDNFVCGNFTAADGAGIAHYGLSTGTRTAMSEEAVPLIARNQVFFNESFNQGVTVNGGGILVAGLPPMGCPLDPNTGLPDPACLADPAQALSPGAGNVIVEANLVQGNSAGGGDGAGLRLERINGQDVNVQGGGRNQTVKVDYRVDVRNNMIVNNVAALRGGGVSIQDALDVNILHNTIANNDNASVAGEAFAPGIPNQSNPQPGAGIVSYAHTQSLSNFLPGTYVAYSDANLVDNIVWQNRKFNWVNDTTVIPANSGLCPDIGGLLGLPCGAAPVYDDLAVFGAAGSLTCTDCILSGGADPMFAAEYVNGNRNTTAALFEAATAIQAPPAPDEGGNFIRLRFGPLTLADTGTGLLFGDYHIEPGSSAVDAGSDALVVNDFDGDVRPLGAGFDIGADEITP